MRTLLIGCFGLVGTLARYGMQGLVQRWWGSAASPVGTTFPYGTLAVNVLGSFVAGFVATYAIERAAVTATWRAAILVGFCGGFTTYSAFALESFELMRAGDPWRAGLNVAAQLVLGVAAVWLGWAAAIAAAR
jgi:CrcB protein